MAGSAGGNEALKPLLSFIGRGGVLGGAAAASDVETQLVTSWRTGGGDGVVDQHRNNKPLQMIPLLSDRGSNFHERLHFLRILGGVHGVSRLLHTDLCHGHSYVHDEQVHFPLTLRDFLDFFVSSLFRDFVHASILSLSILSSSLSLLPFFPDPSHTRLLRASSTFASLSVMCLLSAATDSHQSHLFRRLQTAASDIFNKPPVRAVRNGRKIRVSLSELVVGDLLELRAGDVIPADGLFVDGNMALNDVVVAGGCATAELFQPDHQARPFLLSGSRVVGGEGRMIVTSVARNGCDEFDVRSVEHECATMPGQCSDGGPLQECMSRIAIAEGKVGFLSAALVFVCVGCHLFLAGNRGANDAGSPHAFAAVFAAFLDTVLAIPLALLVVTVPEGLPIATALCSGYSLTHLRHKGILTRNLGALETIGLATTICIDESVVDGLDSNEASSTTTTKRVGVNTHAASWWCDVERLRRNGVRVVMMCRRDLSVAKSMVGSMIREGIDSAIEAKEFREWSEKERREKLGRVAVLASAEESERVMLVKELQQAGEVVAVVVRAGDGEEAVAALLSAADVCISAPFSGGDDSAVAASEHVQSGAVDMILLGSGSSLWALSEAVLSSRRMYSKLRNLLEFQLTGNFVLAVVMVVWAVTRGESPMTAAELLWANVLMDGLAATAVIIAGIGNKDGYFSEEEVEGDQMLKNVAKATVISWRRGGDSDDQEEDRETGSARGYPYNMLWRRAGAGAIAQAAMLIALSFVSVAPWRFRDRNWIFLSSSQHSRGPLIFSTFIFCQVFDLFFSRTQVVSFRRRILGRGSEPQQARKSSHDPRLLALLWLSVFVFFGGMMLLLLVVGQLQWQEWLLSVFLAAVWCLCGRRMRGSRAKVSKKTTELVRLLDTVHQIIKLRCTGFPSG